MNLNHRIRQYLYLWTRALELPKQYRGGIERRMNRVWRDLLTPADRVAVLEYLDGDK